MFKQSFFCPLVCLMLSACVLQSEKPIYSEAEGSLILKSYGTVFAAESFENDAWKSDDGTLTFTESGNHYTVTTSKDDTAAEALFVDVGQGLAMVQFNEKDKPSTYLLAEPQKDAVLLRPLMCSDVKKSPLRSAIVTYKDSDCTLNGKPGAADINAWVKAIGAAKMRMTPVT